MLSFSVLQVFATIFYDFRNNFAKFCRIFETVFQEWIRRGVLTQLSDKGLQAGGEEPLGCAQPQHLVVGGVDHLKGRRTLNYICASHWQRSRLHILGSGPGFESCISHREKTLENRQGQCVYSTVQSENAEENFAMRQNKIYCIHYTYMELFRIRIHYNANPDPNKQTKTLFYLRYRYQYSKCYSKMFNILDFYFYFLFFISFIRIHEAPPFCGSMRIRVRNREFNDLKINYCLQYENPASRSPNPAKFMF